MEGGEWGGWRERRGEEKSESGGEMTNINMQIWYVRDGNLWESRQIQCSEIHSGV